MERRRAEASGGFQITYPSPLQVFLEALTEKTRLLLKMKFAKKQTFNQNEKIYLQYTNCKNYSISHAQNFSCASKSIKTD